jgi:flagella basal body P-ring formation protein FlgA
MRACLAVTLWLYAIPAQAAGLRPYTELNTGTVRLGDLFDGLGDTPDRVLGPAPAPGQSITVEAPQLAAIARDFGVDWRPTSGAERSVLQRRGKPVPAAQVTDCLTKALRAAGAPADGDVVLPTFDPPMVGAGATATLEASQVAYDQDSGRFTAMLTVHDGEGDIPALRLSGQVVAMRDAATLTHHLPIGAVLTTTDVQQTRVRAATLRGVTPLLARQAIGMALRHEVAAGQPLTPGDVMRPVTIMRGGTVRMVLDTAGMSLSAIGVALESGGVGDTIRVQNPTSHAAVVGEITAAGTVRVAAGTVPQLNLANSQ